MSRPPALILASRSQARAALLRQMGVRFSVAHASTSERTRLAGRPVEELVVANALAKARAVAATRTSGIVIGADTVVLVGRRIIGKPKHIADAVRSLALLSRKPQAVYTGLAIIDAATGTERTACEKTIVHMRRLAEREIRAYFRTVSPLDKAGSFDIQGRGGIFVDRIDGCFYNVVGLPLSRLAVMLKAFNVTL